METGSKPKVNFQKAFSVVPDREGINTGEKRLVHITRTGISVANFNSELLTLTSLNGFSFPYRIDDGSWAGIIREVGSNEEVSGSTYLVEPSSFLAIPSNLFRETDLSYHLGTIGQSTMGQSTIINEIPDLGLHLVSTVPEVVNEQFSLETVIPDILPVIRSASGSGAGSVHVMIRAEHIDVFAFQNGLKLCNRFTAEHENDILYFVVAAIEQCGLSTEQVQLRVTGTEQRTTPNIQLLAKYFADVAEPEIPSKLKVPYSFKDVKAWWCWPLLNAYLCV